MFDAKRASFHWEGVAAVLDRVVHLYISTRNIVSSPTTAMVTASPIRTCSHVSTGWVWFHLVSTIDVLMPSCNEVVLNRLPPRDRLCLKSPEKLRPYVVFVLFCHGVSMFVLDNC